MSMKSKINIITLLVEILFIAIGFIFWFTGMTTALWIYLLVFAAFGVSAFCHMLARWVLPYSPKNDADEDETLLEEETEDSTNTFYDPITDQTYIADQ